MRKTLIALAVMTATGAAFAQVSAKNTPIGTSSLTIAGTVDVGMTRGTASGPGSGNIIAITSGNNAISKLIFRGTEDLGGGLYTNFWLESQINADTGQAGSVGSTNNQQFTALGQSLNFARRATVGVTDYWGEVRLGRDVVPSLWNIVDCDPFTNLGVGAMLGATSPFTGLNAGALYTLLPVGHSSGGPWARASNMIEYLTPQTWGGVYGHFARFFGETPQDGSVGENDGNGTSLRVGYAAGRVNVAYGWEHITFRNTPTGTAAGSPTGDMHNQNIGGDLNLGYVDLLAMYESDKREGATPAQGRNINFGAKVPVGVGEIKVSFGDYRIDAGTGTVPHARKMAIGYVHNLSKRTALYTTAARVNNYDGARVSLGASVIGTGLTGASSNGFEMGIRHNF